MDGKAAIEDNRQALMRILAALVAMAGFRERFTSFLRDGAPLHGLAKADESRPSLAPALPRRLHRAVLRLLRPAESAARRLIIALAQGLVVVLPPSPSRAADQKSNPTILRNGVGTGIVLPLGAQAVRPDLDKSLAARRPLAFPLADPLRRWPGGPRRPVAGGVPRIGVPGVTARAVLPLRTLPAPDDPIDAGRLHRRIGALAAALDDLPGQALRFARWRARRQHSLAQDRHRRLSPLRPGRPPGGRLSRYDPSARRSRKIREVDEVLAHAHALAVHALERHDTS